MQTRYQKARLQCPICFDPISIQGHLDKCSHIFCAACITKWAENENSCPLCKKRFSWISRVSTRPNYNEKARKKTYFECKIRSKLRVQKKNQQERNPFVQIYVNSLESHQFLNINQDIQFLSFLLNLQQELNQL